MPSSPPQDPGLAMGEPRAEPPDPAAPRVPGWRGWVHERAFWVGALAFQAPVLAFWLADILGFLCLFLALVGMAIVLVRAIRRLDIPGAWRGLAWFATFPVLSFLHLQLQFPLKLLWAHHRIMQAVRETPAIGKVPFPLRDDLRERYGVDVDTPMGDGSHVFTCELPGGSGLFFRSGWVLTREGAHPGAFDMPDGLWMGPPSDHRSRVLAVGWNLFWRHR